MKHQTSFSTLTTKPVYFPKKRYSLHPKISVSSLVQLCTKASKKLRHLFWDGGGTCEFDHPFWLRTCVKDFYIYMCERFSQFFYVKNIIQPSRIYSQVPICISDYVAFSYRHIGNQFAYDFMFPMHRLTCLYLLGDGGGIARPLPYVNSTIPSGEVPCIITTKIYSYSIYPYA